MYACIRAESTALARVCGCHESVHAFYTNAMLYHSFSARRSALSIHFSVTSKHSAALETCAVCSLLILNPIIRIYLYDIRIARSFRVCVKTVNVSRFNSESIVNTKAKVAQNIPLDVVKAFFLFSFSVRWHSSAHSDLCCKRLNRIHTTPKLISCSQSIFIQFRNPLNHSQRNVKQCWNLRSINLLCSHIDQSRRGDF